jgi:DNA polymerase IV
MEFLNGIDISALTSYDDFRKIIHVDMDAFYASVEQRDNPELRGKPVAVGGGEKRGVTTTASYEARKYGVKSAMPGWKAKELCPDLIFVPLRFDVYKETSRQIRAIFESYTPIYEPLSLDEAYLDVTKGLKDITYAKDIAMSIKKDIYEKTGLTASAGVSYCKFLAKIASDFRKPDGITVITPRYAESFINALPIEKFYGVGKVTASKMKELGIHNGADLRTKELEFLKRYFGKSGSYYFHVARGIDNRLVENNRERKSIAVERTYDDILTSNEQVLEKVELIAQKLHGVISKSNVNGKTLTLKIKSKDFTTRTRCITKDEPFRSYDDIYSEGQALVMNNAEICKDLRLVGLTISNFEDEETMPKKSLEKTQKMDLFNNYDI